MQKIAIARDDKWYLAWPDVTLCPSGKLVCIFSECTHHRDRSYTRIMLSESCDRGRSWSSPRPLTEGTADCD
jgi:sialidase-1